MALKQLNKEIQCCGSGYGSGSSESEPGSRVRFLTRVLMTKNFLIKKIIVYLSLGLLKGRLSYRRSFHPSIENI
jgi:hypothetical protein